MMEQVQENEVMNEGGCLGLAVTIIAALFLLGFGVYVLLAK